MCRLCRYINLLYNLRCIYNKIKIRYYINYHIKKGNKYLDEKNNCLTESECNAKSGRYAGTDII